MKKAAIYLRVSTSDQNYDRQEVELKALANALGYEVIYVFEEKKSAVLKMDTREQLTEMRKLTKEDIDKIFIWDITRLSRRAIDFITIINEFADKGICIHFKDKNIITLDDDGSLNALTGMYLYLLGVFAQMDAENLKAKLKSGKEAALLKGNSYTNIGAFGYGIRDKHLYINEDEAKYVRMAFQLYKEGKDTQYIADIFNANKVPLKSKRTDIVWVKGTISQILKNTVYYGKGKREQVIRKATKDTPAEVNVRYFDAPAIISKELYEECRRVATKNISKQDKSRKIICLLRGLLVCGLCGKYYVLGNNNKQREYRDGDIRANVNNRIGCKNGSIKASIADSLVWRSIQGIYKYNKYKEKCLEEKERNRTELDQNEASIIELNKEISAFDNQISRLNKSYLKGLFTDEEFAKEKLGINADKARLERIIEEIRARNLVLTDRINSDYDYAAALTERELLVEEKKQICNDLIDNVKIYSYGLNRKLLQINMKLGITYNLLVDTHYLINSYCIVDDSIVTFNNPFENNKLLSNNGVDVPLSDFEVTSNNNELFGDEVLGGYSFDEIWSIMNKYNYIESI